MLFDKLHKNTFIFIDFYILSQIFNSNKPQWQQFDVNQRALNWDAQKQKLTTIQIQIDRRASFCNIRCELFKWTPTIDRG